MNFTGGVLGSSCVGSIGYGEKSIKQKRVTHVGETKVLCQQHTVYKMVCTNMSIPYLYNCFAASRSALPLLPV